MPEAQLDRFLLQINVDYPDEAAERRMMIETTGAGIPPVHPVMTAQELLQAQRLLRRVPVGDRVVDAILKLVRAGRPASGSGSRSPNRSPGPGPRASQALMLAVRVRLLQGLRAVDRRRRRGAAGAAPPHGADFHRRAEGVTLDRVIQRLCAEVA